MVSNLIEKYVSMILNKYKDYCKTIIMYGSNCLGENTQDLDVCIFISPNVDNYIKEEIIKDTKQFSIDSGLKIDEEISYENKLMYSIDEVEAYVLTNPFINRQGEYEIKDIVKSKEFLNSDEMRHRLLLNILTTYHSVAYGDRVFVECCEKKAWYIIYTTIMHYYKWTKLDVDSFIEGLYTNKKTNQKGEMFLGYKYNNKKKDEFLRESIYKYCLGFDENVDNLASNLNPYFPTPSMEKDIISFLDKIKEYPENKDITVRKRVAQFLNVESSQVIMTNGVMEGISLVVDCLDCDKTAILTPTFWAYENRLDKLNKKYDEIKFMDVEQNYYEIIRETAKRYDCIILCNPNNPTLDELSYEQLTSLIAENKNCCFVIDESMLAFRIDYVKNSLINCIGKYKNLIVLLSMSKISGMSALRGGFVFSDSVLIEKLIKKRALYVTNIVSQDIFSNYFEQIVIDSFYKKKIKDNLELFKNKLNMGHIKKVIFNDTAYVILVFEENVDINKLEEYLAEQKILVRNLNSAYPDYKYNSIRVSVGTKEQMLKVAAYINLFFEEM